MGRLPDRVAIIGTSIPGGGAVLSVHLRRFLESHGISVDFIDGNLYTLREIYRQRANPSAAKEPVLKCVLQEITRRLREHKYPIVIAIEREDIFLEKFPTSSRRFYFCTAPLAYERYYRWLYNGEPEAENKLQKALDIERSIYESADIITFAWNTYETFVRKNVYNGNNIFSHPGLGWYGCEPRTKRVEYQEALKLIYLGNIDYWSNPTLLADLTERTQFPIHCYGRALVPFSGDKHFGYVKNEWETLNKYQFGLNTVSTDPLRKVGFPSKVFTYLNVGLPSLSPTWQIFSHQVSGVIPYRTDNFVELVEKHHKQDIWQKFSNLAYAQAQELHWQKVLFPLLELLKE